MIINRDHFVLKIAETEAELVAAQRLRYRVFVEEMGARPAFDAVVGQASDAFDPYLDHLILKDRGFIYQPIAIINLNKPRKIGSD